MTDCMHELSRNNEYYLSKLRMNELRNFCYQADTWKAQLNCVDSMARIPYDILERVQSSAKGDPTYYAAEVRESANRKLRMINNALSLTTDDPILRRQLYLVITTPSLSYNKLSAREVVQVGMKAFYKLCHKFYWYLSILRD